MKIFESFTDAMKCCGKINVKNLIFPGKERSSAKSIGANQSRK